MHGVKQRERGLVDEGNDWDASGQGSVVDGHNRVTLDCSTNRLRTSENVTRCLQRRE